MGKSKKKWVSGIFLLFVDNSPLNESFKMHCEKTKSAHTGMLLMQSSPVHKITEIQK